MATLVYEFDPEEFALDDDMSTSPFWALQKCTVFNGNDFESPINLKYDIWEEENKCINSIRVINSFTELKRQKTDEYNENCNNYYELKFKISANSIKWIIQIE